MHLRRVYIQVQVQVGVYFLCPFFHNHLRSISGPAKCQNIKVGATVFHRCYPTYILTSENLYSVPYKKLLILSLYSQKQIRIFSDSLLSSTHVSYIFTDQVLHNKHFSLHFYFIRYPFFP